MKRADAVVADQESSDIPVFAIERNQSRANDIVVVFSFTGLEACGKNHANVFVCPPQQNKVADVT